jgi:hypothetical protein
MLVCISPQFNPTVFHFYPLFLDQRKTSTIASCGVFINVAKKMQEFGAKPLTTF